VTIHLPVLIDGIQIKGPLLSFKPCGSYSVMVMHYAFYALGFQFESHLADVGFVFFFRLSFSFFSLLIFRLTFYVYESVLG